MRLVNTLSEFIFTTSVDILRTAREHAAMNKLDLAIESIGGLVKLSKAIGVKPNVVGNWRMRGGRVPAEHCIAVENAAKGAVTRYELRPDVFGTEEPSNAAAA